MDEGGVAHAVALPDPTQLMSGLFRASLDALVSMRHDEVLELLERVQEETYEQRWSIPVDPAYEHASPPQGLLDVEVWAEDDLEAALKGVDLRWRLDAVLALDDYVD
jgi:hypothetical protein